MLRLVIDARLSNAARRPPPRSELATPAALSRLLLSDEALAWSAAEKAKLGRGAHAAVCDPPLAPLGVEPEGSSADLTDGFYQFKSELLAA
eukprot:494693-Lingulodinium_polyedra.AAC.1